MTEAAWDLFIKALPHALFTVGLVALFKLDRLNAEWVDGAMSRTPHAAGAPTAIPLRL